MARPGLKTMRLRGVEGILRRQREGNHDVYLPLSRLGVAARTTPDGSHGRYAMTVRTESGSRTLDPTAHAVRQIASLAGVPVPFLERMPTSIGLTTLRACLTLSVETRDDPLMLFRVGNDGRRLRAILPSGFVRFDDREVFAEVCRVAAGKDLSVTNLKVDDDVFHLRMVGKESLNLGTSRAPDPAFPGVDLRTSETGRFPLEVRRVLFRVVCENGMTEVTEAQQKLRRKKIGMDRDRFGELFQAGLAEAVDWGRKSVGRLHRAHGEFVQEPVEEVERIFRHYRLGSPQSVGGRLVMQELVKSMNLLGVTRFEMVQAFTRAAQALEPEHRSRWEDGMGEYLFKGFSRN